MISYNVLHFMGLNGKYSETIAKFITENFLFGEDENLTSDTPLFEKGIIDSTGILELVAFIEDNYNVTVRDEELVMENFHNIHSIESFLEFKLNKK